MTSIRGKIALGYSLLAGVAVAFTLFAYADLGFLQRRVLEGASVSAFREATQEMRRHEKNFLLYRDPADLQATLDFAALASQHLQERTALVPLAGEREVALLAQRLDQYAELMRAYAPGLDFTSPEASNLALQVRQAGHAISEEADALGQRERAVLATTVQQSRWALFASMAIVVLLGGLIGYLMSRAVVRPLRRLEAELKPIAEGRFAAFHQVSKDREIVSLTEALNRMLEELDSRRRQVLQSEKLASLGVLASGVAHELNNPLGNISSSCQILEEELDTADRDSQRLWLAQIDSETERARRIVRTLLDYSRRRAFSPERLPLEEVLEKCLTLMRNELPSRDTVRLSIPPDLVVCGDEPQLQQVFINLIKNALDAGGEGVHISIGAERTSWQASRPSAGACLMGDTQLCDRDDASLVAISVADDGPGIPADLLSKVFDPFFTTREPGQGVGLGLYVVEEIILEHGGCIAVENQATSGTRFTIWLPCRADGTKHE